MTALVRPGDVDRFVLDPDLPRPADRLFEALGAGEWRGPEGATVGVPERLVEAIEEVQIACVAEAQSEGGSVGVEVKAICGRWPVPVTLMTKVTLSLVVVAWMLMSGSVSAPPRNRTVPRVTSKRVPAKE